jgi:YHS domain-containing protein
VKDPDPYLNALDITLACAVDPGKPAVVDARHRLSVNWETYYVSSDDALERFQASPHVYTGLVTDPTERRRFQPVPGSPTREYDGHLFYFASEGTAKQFDEDPGRYAEPMLGMVEMP